ncbi:MAG: glycosyltransferase family 2 protein [Oscillospiraceae bacterium]|jgi:glycosyltransferase involved in cell wall biosynthesis|nr:glycosyltransferase family 2 protein [Oscillospiraceae bacterium]
MKKISFIIPVFNEAESLETLCSRIIEQIKILTDKNVINDYEIWFIDDGSNDTSVSVVKELIETDSKVKLISFRRNFGKATALQAGFRHSSGDYIITMDADLQDDPSDVPRMLQKLEEGYDLISGWKKDRKDSFEKRIPSKLFNAVTSTLSGLKLHDFNCGFKAYKREVVTNIDLYGELHRYIPVLAHRRGFRVTEIPVTHHKRKHGKSKYGFERYLRGFFDSLTATFLSRFYNKPMYFFGLLGLFFFLAGFAICTVLTIQWFMGIGIGGRPLLNLGVLLIILGVQSISTGFIGDMVVDATFRNRYNEAHVKEIIDVKENKTT